MKVSYDLSDKISPALALAMDSQSDLYTSEFTILFRYTGFFSDIEQAYQVRVLPLLNQFAIGSATYEQILLLSGDSHILYLDIAHQMTYAQAVSTKDKIASCFPMYKQTDQTLRGTGILAGIVDSGIDLYHPALIREDGSSRILAYWDQFHTSASTSLYGFGTVYDSKQINQEIKNPGKKLFQDPSGHGTAVASILSALSPDVDIIAVASKPDTAGFLCGIDFVARFAILKGKPLVINLSYGNNYGAHDGTSFTELYIDALIKNGRFTVITGMGNEGNTARHKRIEGTFAQEIEIITGPGLANFNLQLWSNSNISYHFQIKAPDGTDSPRYSSSDSGQFYTWKFKHTDLAIQIGQSNPYNKKQEIFIRYTGTPVWEGGWYLAIIPDFNTYYQIDAWLPVAASTSANVEFGVPSTDLTLTIPASASSVISVGAYDTALLALAPFSGKGSVMVQKPDILAPGIHIMTANAGGGYTTRSGTSFSVPFVTAAVANLMQWGIIERNDPFLYGERVKTYLQAGAIPLPGSLVIPNASEGYGRLCANACIPKNL